MRNFWIIFGRMSWKKFNPNPQGLLVGDCVIRAICAVTGNSWTFIHKELCDLSRDMADWPNADRVWWQYLQWKEFDQQKLINQCPNCITVADFAHDHPKGIYILGPTEHAVAVMNGDWYDTWDSGNTIPTYYFRRYEHVSEWK